MNAREINNKAKRYARPSCTGSQNRLNVDLDLRNSRRRDDSERKRETRGAFFDEEGDPRQLHSMYRNYVGV